MVKRGVASAAPFACLLVCSFDYTKVSYKNDLTILKYMLYCWTMIKLLIIEARDGNYYLIPEMQSDHLEIVARWDHDLYKKFQFLPCNRVDDELNNCWADGIPFTHDNIMMLTIELPSVSFVME